MIDTVENQTSTITGGVETTPL